MKLRVLHPRLCDNYNILFRICCACKIGQVSIAYDIYTQNTFNQEENRNSLCYYLNLAQLNLHITSGKTATANKWTESFQDGGRLYVIRQRLADDE